jgi:hypothetical protein
MHALSPLPSSPILGSKQPIPRSSSSMLASFQKLLLTLYSPCPRLGSVCMNTLRLLSLKMATAILGSQSLILGEPRLHASLPPDLTSAGEGCPIECHCLLSKGLQPPARLHRSVMPTLHQRGRSGLYRGQGHPI